MDHASNITINLSAVLGENATIYKGTISDSAIMKNGERQAHIIGNNVYIRLNSAIVGGGIIGNDVLIAPGAFINCDIPDHSIVIGNPPMCHERSGATNGYLINSIRLMALL